MTEREQAKEERDMLLSHRAMDVKTILLGDLVYSPICDYYGMITSISDNYTDFRVSWFTHDGGSTPWPDEFGPWSIKYLVLHYKKLLKKESK